jgi:hypothetical protein
MGSVTGVSNRLIPSADGNLSWIIALYARRAGFERAVFVIKRTTKLISIAAGHRAACRCASHIKAGRPARGVAVPDGLVKPGSRARRAGRPGADRRALRVINATILRRGGLSAGVRPPDELAKRRGLLMLGYGFSTRWSPTGFVARGVCDVAADDA